MIEHSRPHSHGLLYENGFRIRHGRGANPSPVLIFPSQRQLYHRAVPAFCDLSEGGEGGNLAFNDSLDVR